MKNQGLCYQPEVPELIRHHVPLKKTKKNQEKKNKKLKTKIKSKL